MSLFDKAKGKLKEARGDLTDDDKLRAEGKTDQAKGDIKDAASLRDWLAAVLADGSGFCDGVFLAQAHRAAVAGDDAGLREIAELAAAFVPSRKSGELSLGLSRISSMGSKGRPTPSAETSALYASAR